MSTKSGISKKAVIVIVVEVIAVGLARLAKLVVELVEAELELELERITALDKAYGRPK